MSTELAPMPRPPWWVGLHHALFNGNGMARRLLVAVIAFSSLVTAIITAAELYGDYRRDLREIDAAFRFIESSHTRSLAHSLWQFDGEAVRTQLEGLLRLPDIEFVGVEVDGQVRWSAGLAQARYPLQAAIDLRHQQAGYAAAIGTLRVVASGDRALARVWNRALVQLLGNGIKTLLVSLFLLLVFQYMVTQHLTRVARFVREIDPARPCASRQVLALDRRSTGRWRPDVLDAVTDAINGLLASARQAQAAAEASQAQLVDREQKFRGIAEMNVDLIFQLAAPGVFSYVSPAVRELFGFAPEEWLSSTLVERVAPEGRERAAELVARVMAGETVRNFELGMPRRDGARLVIEANATPLRQDAQVVGVQGVLRDITERRRSEEALLDANSRLETRVRERTVALEAARDDAERANRAKSEFLSRMSHELRTPMNAILGFTQILQNSSQDERQQRWVSEIRQAGEHLLELIDELLDLARIEGGRLNVRLEPVELQPVMQEAGAMCKMAAEARQVSLVMEGLDPGLAVLADRTRLRQVLLNLLSNAIKYNRLGGRVDVRYRRPAPGRLRLTVSDTGLGLSPDQIDRLFQPFERLGREESDVQGSGIGLALSKQLAELMHCTLGAASVQGLGASFWIDMPVAAAASAVAQGPPAPAATPAAGRMLRVLYIEDNQVNVALMRAIFESRPDLELLTAPDGPAGLDKARTERPGVILLDIQLPGMNGYEVLQALRSEPALSSVPVIAVSADAMPHDVARGLGAGFAAYIAKPIRFGELLQRLDEIAARA